jgi:hypothetical protein
MRPRLVILIPVLLVVVATAAWFLGGPKPPVPTDDPVPPVTDQTADADAGTTNPLPGATPGTEVPRVSASSTIADKGIAIPDEATAQTPEAKREAHVARRVAELQDLGMEDDPESLKAILSELANPEPEIRQAAVDASVQFGSRDAIPRLLDAAARTDDPEEKSAILEAVEFLKMPTLAEAMAQTNQPTPPAASGARSNP